MFAPANQTHFALAIDRVAQGDSGKRLLPDGPYQRWLARTPAALKLAPELRIQHMDNDCLNTETNKEVS